MPKNSVPVVPGGNGNSEHSPLPLIKSENALYKYDFVINNWTEEELCQLIKYLPQIAKKCIVAKEIGTENQVPHLQCYISLKLKMRIVQLHQVPGLERASMRPVRNEKALIDYCEKDGDIVLRIGFPKPVKVLEKLYSWQQKIEDIFFTEPNDRKIYWFWESYGNIGKSAFVKYMVIKHKALFCDGGKKADLVNLVFNNDMDECKCIIWDLPRSTKGNISYSTLESVKNGLVCNTKYETGVKAFNAPHVFVFANYPPENPEQLSSDRWVIEELKPA